jgi:hypothetical protein
MFILWKRVNLVTIGLFVIIVSGCTRSSDANQKKRTDELEHRISVLEERLHKVPQQQDLNGIKESINSVKPQIERLEPLLASLLIKREAGEREDQWLARVKERIEASREEALPGVGVISKEANCEASVGGVRLSVWSMKLSRRDAEIWIEFNGRVDSDVAIDAGEIYLTDNLGHRYKVKSVDRTHLTEPELLKLHAGEMVRTYFTVPPVDIKAKLFQLYWPQCGVIDFAPKDSLTVE